MKVAHYSTVKEEMNYKCLADQHRGPLQICSRMLVNIPFLPQQNSVMIYVTFQQFDTLSNNVNSYAL